MAEVKLYNKEGKTSGTVTLPDALFSVTVRTDVLHSAVVAQNANSRVRYAQTKDRSEVAGTGKKPWKQKGTGRARHGSRRSPIWVGGGITFGPTAMRNFAMKINKKLRRKALAMALSSKVASEQLIVVDGNMSELAKTKDVVALRNALPGAGKSTIIVTAADDTGLIRAAKNLPKTTTLGAKSLNVRDLLKSEYVIASKSAVDEITNTYLA